MDCLKNLCIWFKYGWHCFQKGLKFMEEFNISICVCLDSLIANFLCYLQFETFTRLRDLLALLSSDSFVIAKRSVLLKYWFGFHGIFIRDRFLFGLFINAGLNVKSVSLLLKSDIKFLQEIFL